MTLVIFLAACPSKHNSISIVATIVRRIVANTVTNAVVIRTNKMIVLNLVMLLRGHTQSVATEIAPSSPLAVNRLQGLLQERNVPST